MVKMNAVLHDPLGNYWEGALVSPEMARELEGRGVATIPMLPELAGRNGAAGWVKRAWGAGWPLSNVPRRISPLVLFVVPGLGTLNWRARVTGPCAVSADAFVRFTSDAQQALVSTSGFVTSPEAVQIAKLGPPDEDGGWTIGGVGKIVAPGEQYLGVSAYGMGPGLLLEWLAVSQTE